MNEPNFDISPEEIAAAEAHFSQSGSIAEEYGFHPDAHNGHWPLPPIIDSVDLLESILPTPTLLIDGLLHKGSKMSLGGCSKTFKSWTFLSIAISISTGHDWLGMDASRDRVLIVNFEIQDYWIRKRLDTLCTARNLRPEKGWLDFWNLRGYSAPHAVIIPQIIARAKDLGYGIVIIDPSYKLIGQGDENSASDVGAMMASFELITVETTAAVLFGAHFAKGNASTKESIDRVSGSGVFARDPDSILTFTPHESPNCFTVEATLRNLPSLSPFVVEWIYPYFQRKPDLDPADLKKRPGPPRCASPDSVRDLLKEASLSSKNWQNLASDELGISRASFFRIKDELSQKGLVLHSKINGLWTAVYPK